MSVDRRSLILGGSAALVAWTIRGSARGEAAFAIDDERLKLGLVRGLEPGIYTQRVVLADGTARELAARTAHADHLWLDLSDMGGKPARVEIARTGGLAAPFDRPPAALGPAPDTAKRVADAQGLLAALSAAKGGEVIALDGAITAPIRLTRATADFATPVTIRSLDPARPATIASLVAEARGLRFVGLRASGDPGRNKPLWRLNGCEDVEIERCRFEGTADEMRGAQPMGLMIRGGKRIAVVYSRFSRFENGFAFFNVDELTVARNRFELMRYDFLRGGGLRRSTIDGNVGSAAVADRAGGGHSDFLQLWTAPPVQRSTEDLEIRNNLFWIGTNAFDRASQFGTHFIFVTETNSEKRDIPPQPYDRVRIYNNLCASNSPQGVWLGHGSSGYVANNLCLGSGPPRPESWGHVRIWSQVRALCANNVAYDFRTMGSGEQGVSLHNNRTLRADLPEVRALIAELVTAALEARLPGIAVPTGPLGGFEDERLPGLGPTLDGGGFPAGEAFVGAG